MMKNQNPDGAGGQLGQSAIDTSAVSRVRPIILYVYITIDTYMHESIRILAKPKLHEQYLCSGRAVELLYGFGSRASVSPVYGTSATKGNRGNGTVRYCTGLIFCDVRCCFSETMPCTTSRTLAGHVSFPIACT